MFQIKIQGFLSTLFLSFFLFLFFTCTALNNVQLHFFISKSKDHPIYHTEFVLKILIEINNFLCLEKMDDSSDIFLFFSKTISDVKKILSNSFYF